MFMSFKKTIFSDPTFAGSKNAVEGSFRLNQTQLFLQSSAKVTGSLSQQLTAGRAIPLRIRSSATVSGCLPFSATGEMLKFLFRQGTPFLP